MKRDNKKALYESIMTSVAREVKKVLNEDAFKDEQKADRKLRREIERFVKECYEDGDDLNDEYTVDMIIEQIRDCYVEPRTWDIADYVYSCIDKLLK